MPKKIIDREPKNPSLKNLTNNFGSIPKKQNELLAKLGAPHVDSFNYAVDDGLNSAISDLDPVEFSLPNGDKVCISIENMKLLEPAVRDGIMCSTNEVYPTEARQCAGNYAGLLTGQIKWSINGCVFRNIEKEFGEVPIMVKSSRCNLFKLTPEELVARREHPEEWGGYFIISGHERLIRMLIMTRRNYPLALKRSGWKKRGSNFSDLGILIRSVQPDQTSVNNVLHFVTDGTAKLMFAMKKNQYYMPLILVMKALVNFTDKHIFQHLMAGYEDNLYFKGCVMAMMQSVHTEGLHTQEHVKQYIGKHFRTRLMDFPEHWTDDQICDYVLKRCVAIHLVRPEDKFRLLVLMAQKLWALVQGRCMVESADSAYTQELLLGGYLWLQYLKERLQQLLLSLRMIVLRDCPHTHSKLTPDMMNILCRRVGGIHRHMSHFLATGNVHTLTGLGLMQDKGLTITVENINRMRYMAHFRSVHRGSFFQQMRTTEARQLLPDAWGFICPVHTPDGAPCGLLNHLTKYCEVSTVPDPAMVAAMPDLLAGLGMVPIDSALVASMRVQHCYTVVLDGCVLGYVPDAQAPALVTELRLLKIKGKEVPSSLEIGFIPKMRNEGGQFPGLFLFTGPTRMMRPVVNLMAQRIELIGTLEQMYMDICISLKEAYPGITTHQELSETSFLSNLASLIPMPDCNQSPRNMYQCQMGKQTMGTALYNLHLQSEAKMYRLQTPASPLFRPAHYDAIGLDNYAMGTNAIVAVISYTGYDMEDAMVINKSSYERGLAHGSVYKTQRYVLPTKDSYFGLEPGRENAGKELDADGMARVADRVTEGSPLCSYYDAGVGKYFVEKWKSTEEGYIEAIRLCNKMENMQKPGVSIVIRIPRNPSIGDKFASRAGQKGICSRLWSTEDMPFTTEGLVPDIVFNPHGFPSRMTIAMMIEIMAGKSAAVHGVVHDATPFRFNEKYTAIDYFGKMLERGGYDYYGTEKMYSGVDGREMNAAIFFGMVHYQRLRHMVADKWQVRSVGAVDVLTHQPVKGRRRGGGVRFGEMERDSLLSHGAAFLLQDRLFHCSDKFTTLVCVKCGNMLSPIELVTGVSRQSMKAKCRLCKDEGKVEEMDIPYIYRFLVMQFASVNINLKFELEKE